MQWPVRRQMCSLQDEVIRAALDPASHAPGAPAKPGSCTTTAAAVGLVEQAGVQAGVPVVVRKQAPSSLAFQQDGSVDAVVSLRTLAGLAPQQQSLCINVGAAASSRGGCVLPGCCL
jgi:hypothetical protein